MRRCLLHLVFVAAAALPAGGASAQDSAEAFFRGKQINVIVGSAAGGGYDIYARLLARHMSKHVPGNPLIIVNNMPGAASNTAAAHIYTVAPKDGTVIGALQNTVVLESALDETKRRRHDASKFLYLGSATVDHYVCIVRGDAAVKSFNDALTQELIVGASQPGTSTRDFPTLLNNMVGTRFRIVTGYPGTRDITHAIEKGEVQALCGFSWSSLSAQRPDWVKSGFVRVLVQEHDKGHPDLNSQGIPLAIDFAKTPENRRVMELMYSAQTFGRPYMLPPGVPADRVAALRTAFLQTMADPDLRAEARRAGLEVDPIPGEALQALTERVFATPADVIERIRQALIYKAP